MQTSRGKLIASFAAGAFVAAFAVLGVAFNFSDTSLPLAPSAQAPIAQVPVAQVPVAPARVTSDKPASAKTALPLGISPQLYALAVAPGHEPAAQLVALGEKLFNDKRLSVDDTVACATCHDPTKG